MFSRSILRSREREIVVRFIKWKLAYNKSCLVVAFPDAAKENVRQGYGVETGIYEKVSSHGFPKSCERNFLVRVIK